MEKKNLEKLREKALAGKIVDGDGNISVTAMNYLSATYTSPLLDEVWGLSFQNIETMDELLELMKQADTDEKHEVFVGILKTLYILTGVFIPEEVQYIIECDDPVMKQMYAHEFLADFTDLMYDFRAEAEETSEN